MTHDDTIKCEVHGSQQTTYVCRHILDGTRDGNRVGFHSAVDPDNPRPDSWCDDCEKRFQSAGGEWDEQAEEKAQIKILCGLCYDKAKNFQLNGVS